MAKAPLDVENLDFEQLDDQKLREMMQRVNEALTARFTVRIQEFRELARQAGYAVTLTKLGKEEPRRSKRQPQEEDRRRGVSPKYRNPDNPQETWAGRGRKPKWVLDRLASGASLDDLLINQDVSQGSGEDAAGV